MTNPSPQPQPAAPIFVVNTDAARLRCFPRNLPHTPETLDRKRSIMEASRTVVEPLEANPVETLKLHPGVNILTAEQARDFRIDLVCRDCKAVVMFDMRSDFEALHWARRSVDARALLVWKSIETRPAVIAAIDTQLAGLKSAPKATRDLIAAAEQQR